MTKEWQKVSGNFVLNGDGFYISFVGSDAAIWKELGFPQDVLDHVTPDTIQGETALVHDGEYFILNGDWRKQYEEVVDHGFKACLQLFMEHREEHESSWSCPLDRLEQALKKCQGNENSN